MKVILVCGIVKRSVLKTLFDMRREPKTAVLEWIRILIVQKLKKKQGNKKIEHFLGVFEPAIDEVIRKSTW